MAYLDTSRHVGRPKLSNASAVPLKWPVRRTDVEMPPVLNQESRRHLHQVQEMALVGLLAAGIILAIAGTMLVRL